MATISEIKRGQRVQLGDKKGTVHYAEPPFMKKPGIARINWDDGAISTLTDSEYWPIVFPFEPDWTEYDIT